MEQMVGQMSVVMDALLTLTKEETQEFANGFLNSGLISLKSNRQKFNFASKPSGRADDELRRLYEDKSGRMNLEQQLGLLTGRSMISQNITERCNALLNERSVRSLAHEQRTLPQ